jgi:hypothetical protein
MKINNPSPVVRVYFKSREEFSLISRFFEACLMGFWLGVLDKQSLQEIDDDYYKNSTKYLGESHNRSGLFSWEEKAVQAYFSENRKIILIGAGGGRETLALGSLGFEVDAFECNLDLLDCARKLLEKEKIAATIQFCPRDHCPSGDRCYDGSIVGYGVYSYIQGWKGRVAFLKDLRARVQTNAPVLLSFLRRMPSIRYRSIDLSHCQYYPRITPQGPHRIG